MRIRSIPTLAAAVFVASSAGVALSLSPLGTPPSLKDFEQPGTQPGEIVDLMEDAGTCAGCHAGYDPDEEPFYGWAGGMMAQSMRDPVFHACLAIAEQDISPVGEMCIRCHSPGGWLEGRSTPTDGSALAGKDYDGVSCHACHRMVDPVYTAGESPSIDFGILAGLSEPPTTASGGSYVVDPLDRRRGPFDLGATFPWHAWEQSPFHQESLLCANCHDVNNPAFTRIGGPVPAASDTYELNDHDTVHPSMDPFDMFPVERTFSEWANSDFAVAPVEMGGRFGGNKTAVSSCQDCHMPDTTGTGCNPALGGEIRSDLPQHTFDGANTWVPLAVYDLDQSLELYSLSEASGYPLEVFQDAVDRNIAMLRNASDTFVSLEEGALRVRVVNESGHKLPTGYPEGRRMWLNVKFFDGLGALIAERGAYDFSTAELTTSDTVVYEMVLGLDAAMATETGLPAGPSFHFALNNVIEFDNRIPPRGFDNAAFEAIQAQPVGVTYADGQHWDENDFEIPCRAASATVTLYYQTTSKEYIEFLRDENYTNDAGDIAYDHWEAQGKSAPVDMDVAQITFDPFMKADVDSLSVSAGGTQVLCLSAGPAHASKVYAVLGSLSGTTPGFPLGSVHIPLNYDLYTDFTLFNANIPPLVNSVGLFDPVDGVGSMQFVLPAGSNPSYIGLTAHHAFVVVNGTNVEAASNAVALQIVP